MSAPRPWSKKLPDGPVDDVVIGSGIGGMTAAALLAHVGRRVCVLEQHWVPGGFTHTFRRGPYTWDVGVHAVGEVTGHTSTGRLLCYLTDGALEWASLGPVYDEFHFPGGFRVDFPDTPRAFRATLHAAFPSETVAIDAYLDRVREVSGAMRGYYLSKALPRPLAPLGDLTLGRRAQPFFETTCQSELEALTADPRLRAVLAAQWGYYGVPPSRASFAIQALVAKHFMHGGYYPRGGSRAIAEGLLGAVARRGGCTSVRRDVRRIRIEGGRARGVELVTGERIEAERVVSAAGCLATATRLLDGAPEADALREALAPLRPAAAHVCLYLGLEGDPRPAGASAANRWFYETWDTEADAWSVDPDAETLPEAPVLYTSFPSLKDPDHAGPHHTAEVVTFVPWSAFARWSGTTWKKRGADYEAFKARLEAALLEQLLRHMPDLRPLLRHVELSTPLSTEAFTRPVAGSIYGLEPTPERFRCGALRPRSPIEGLYLAGSEVATVGVVGAMMGGVLAALAAEPWRVGRLLRRAA